MLKYVLIALLFLAEAVVAQVAPDNAPILFLSTANGSSGTVYNTVVYDWSTSAANEEYVKLTVPQAMRFANMSVHCTASMSDLTVTLRKNGQGTAVTCTTSGSTRCASALGDYAEFAAGDRLSLEGTRPTGAWNCRVAMDQLAIGGASPAHHWFVPASAQFTQIEGSYVYCGAGDNETLEAGSGNGAPCHQDPTQSGIVAAVNGTVEALSLDLGKVMDHSLGAEGRFINLTKGTESDLVVTVVAGSTHAYQTSCTQNCDFDEGDRIALKIRVLPSTSTYDATVYLKWGMVYAVRAPSIGWMLAWEDSNPTYNGSFYSAGIYGGFTNINDSWPISHNICLQNWRFGFYGAADRTGSGSLGFLTDPDTHADANTTLSVCEIPEENQGNRSHSCSWNGAGICSKSTAENLTFNGDPSVYNGYLPNTYNWWSSVEVVASGKSYPPNATGRDPWGRASLMFSSTGSPSGSNPVYGVSAGAYGAQEEYESLRIVDSWRISNLHVNCAANMNKTTVWSIRIEEADSGLTCQMDSGQSECSDLVHTATVESGQMINWKNTNTYWTNQCNLMLTVTLPDGSSAPATIWWNGNGTSGIMTPDSYCTADLGDVCTSTDINAGTIIPSGGILERVGFNAYVGGMGTEGAALTLGRTDLGVFVPTNLKMKLGGRGGKYPSLWRNLTCTDGCLVPNAAEVQFKVALEKTPASNSQQNKLIQIRNTGHIISMRVPRGSWGATRYSNQHRNPDATPAVAEYRADARAHAQNLWVEMSAVAPNPVTVTLCSGATSPATCTGTRPSCTIPAGETACHDTSNYVWIEQGDHFSVKITDPGIGSGTLSYAFEMGPAETPTSTPTVTPNATSTPTPSPTQPEISRCISPTPTSTAGPGCCACPYGTPAVCRQPVGLGCPDNCGTPIAGSSCVSVSP